MIAALDIGQLTGLLVALGAVLGPGGIVALITALTRRELRKSVGDDDRTVMQALDELRADQGERFTGLESRVAALEDRLPNGEA